MKNFNELETNDFLYFENFLEKDLLHTEVLDFLKNKIDYEKRKIVVFGKEYFQPRLIKYFGEKNYSYSNSILKKEKMPEIIFKLKEFCESKFSIKLNCVLINYYRDENDSMGKHSDDEKELGSSPNIVSISFGDDRDFIIQNKKTKENYKLVLKDNSALLMIGSSQRDFFHEVRKVKTKKNFRINLTFRYIY